MRQYADDETAMTEIRELNENCRAMIGNIHGIVEKLTELGGYYKDKSSSYKNYINSTRMKNAGADLTVLSRRLLHVTKDLKHIASLKFPHIETFLEEEDDKKQGFTNKIDKNVKVAKNARKKEELDGEEKAIPARNSS